MKLEINYGTDVFVLPKANIKEKLSNAESVDLKLLLLIACDSDLRENFNAETAAKELKCTKPEIDASLKFWIGAGIFNSTAAVLPPQNQKKLPDNDTPNYTGKEIGDILEKNKDLKWLIDECQNIVGKILNPTEINKIVGLADYLRLEHEHILMIFMYCRKFGKLSVVYIEKTAYSLYDEGIDTLPKFEAYIKMQEEYESTTGKLRSLFGFGDRAFTAKETGFFTDWCMNWGFSLELITLAYETMISKTENHKLSLPYMNTVLKNWYEAGYRTMEEVLTALEAYEQNKEKSKNTNSSFNTDEFFELALKRSKEKKL
ncbi:MAG: DnaD domain protein [Oscillospiraceae bacterium]|nr:DnaD domain protein [Oscillospiraceae bacterium]